MKKIIFTFTLKGTNRDLTEEIDLDTKTTDQTLETVHAIRTAKQFLGYEEPPVELEETQSFGSLIIHLPSVCALKIDADEAARTYLEKQHLLSV